MIHTELLEQAIKLAVYSTSVENEKPVSMLLVAKPEHAKSEILKLFSTVKQVFYTSDFNTFVFSDFAGDYLSGSKKTIMIPDFLKVVKKKQSTQANALTLLNAITEEGFTGRIMGGSYIDKPLVANVITAITQREMSDKRHKWAELGFLSRFVPLSYSYNNGTKQLIREFIKQRDYHRDKTYTFVPPEKPKKIALPSEMADLIEKISIDIAKENDLTGFRLQKQLQTLCMTNAMLNGRDIVLQADVDTVSVIAQFINFNFTSI